MSATTSVKESNGATPDVTTITNCRLCTSDAYNPGTNYPLVKPAAGSNYSYWKHLYLNADDSPTGTINNIKFYSDGTIGWTGVTLKAGVVDTYDQATGTEGTTGDEANANHSGTPTMTDVATYTSGSPLSLTGSIDNPDTGKISQYLVLQGVLSTDAVAGALAAETLTFRYDET